MPKEALARRMQQRKQVRCCRNQQKEVRERAKRTRLLSVDTPHLSQARPNRNLLGGKGALHEAEALWHRGSVVRDPLPVGELHLAADRHLL